MSLDLKSDRPVHFPKDPNKFEFDAEVATIFENIAERSIPNFRIAHETHVTMIEPWLTDTTCRVMDVGASRGSFISAIERAHPDAVKAGSIRTYAIDNSPDMCGHLRLDHPLSHVRCMDVTGEEFMNWDEQFDVVCAHYILQFVPYANQQAVLLKLISMVRPGGVFIFGHKAEHEHAGALGWSAHEQYINWRVGNGYTRAEIESKTLALKGSMFPISHSFVMSTLEQNFFQVMETFRFMMFSTVMAVK